MIELQLYLPNNENAIIKKFGKISDPTSISYASYEKIEVISYISRERAKAFIENIKGAEFNETSFPDIVIMKAPKELFGKVKFPRWVKHIESDPHFSEAISAFRKVQSKNLIGVLPILPQMSDSLKRRLNLECMCEGIKGRTLLAPIDSIAAEFPAVTVFSNMDKTVFSKAFPRKKYALYQDNFVNLYLSDCQIKRDLLKTNFPREGRAAPDITITDIDSYLILIQEINEARKKAELPPIGHLNPTLYQNASIFSRKSTGSSDFPTTYAIWSANRGLGKVKQNKLERLLSSLPSAKKCFTSRCCCFVMNLLRSSLM